MGEGPSPADPLIGRVIERCRILSRIAHGGMGVVYLAEHTALKRRVALKILPAEVARDRDYVARFRREAVAAARLEHPNIIQVYDVGEHEGMPFMVRQYVEGLSLAEILKSSGRLDPKEAARVAREVARGLSAAHAQGVVHRDIKPENILVSENGEVRLGDFGIALDPDASGASPAKDLLVGTPYYLSPEQAEGKKSDARSDLYSLGVTLYSMVTGRVPFTGPSVAAVLYKHVHEAPRRPSASARDLPPYFEDVILRLMKKKPADRYQTAEEAERDLDRYLRGVYPRAKRETVPTGRWARKSGPPRAAIWTAAGAALALLILLVSILTRPGKTEPPAPAPKIPAPPAAPETTRQKEDRPPEVIERIVPPAPPPDPETGFAALYRAKPDKRHWAHSPGLERKVFFLDDSILVSFPSAGADSDDVEFLAVNQRDLEEFVLRFEIRSSGAGLPEICAGKLLLGEPALPGRNRTTSLKPPDLPAGEWHAIEIEAKEGRLRLASGTRVLASGAFEEKASPFGRVGFLCKPGADFEVRHARIRILKRADLSRIAREPPPSPPPDPDPAPPEEAQAIEKLKAAPDAEVPPLARRLRDLAFSRPALEAYDGKSLEGWRIVGTGAAESVRPRDGWIEVAAKGKSAFLERGEFPAARGLSFEIRVRQFHGATGGGLALHRRTPTHYTTLTVARGEAILREQEGPQGKTLARRDLPATPDRWVRIDMVVAGGQTCLFVDDAFLWRGPSVEPDALGPAALLAADVECDLRAIKVYPRP